MLKDYRKKIKKHLEEVIKIKDSPRAIALGFAIGTAIALLPTLGLGIFIGLGIVLIFKKISKISLFASFVVWNIAILALLVPVEYKLGNFLLKNVPTTAYKIEILNRIFVYSRGYLLGNIIITVIFTTLSYLIIYYLAKKYQKQYREIVQEPLEKAIETVEEGLQKI